MNLQESTIAIDFGTTNSVVYSNKDNTMEHVPAGNYGMNQGTTMFPSYVEYTKSGIVVGRIPKNNFGKKNKFVVAAVKRIIGQTYEEYEKMKDKSIFGCEVVKGEDGYPYFIVNEDGKRVSPIEVASELFKVMKREAENFRGKEIIQAYMTVPANFKDNQCKAIKKAAEIAGLKVLKLITEPAAAAMSWCLDTYKLNVGENMIVYDFGGSTFDVSLVQYKGDKGFVVRAVDGNPNLGGNDIDDAILDLMVKKCKRTTGVDISERVNSRRYRNSLRSSCEVAKIVITDGCSSYYDDDENTFLRNTAAVKCPVPFSEICMDGVDDIDCTSEDLNDAIREKVEETIDITIRMMEKEELPMDDIRYEMLVGGSSHLHLIKQLLHKLFIRAQFPILNLNEAVAIGAMKSFMDSNGGCIRKKSVVSYGLQTSNGEVALFLKRGENIPALSREIIFTNSYDYMDCIKTKIYQWEGDPYDSSRVHMVVGIPCVPLDECTCVKSLSFKNEHPKPKGEQQLIMMFHLDVDGNLQVICKDREENELLSIT